MLKKIVIAVVSLIFVTASVFASVDVNKADQAALDGIRGIGPSLSNAILLERSKGGEFKDWQDFEKRVKGVSDKNSARFSKAGLVVNGQPKEGASPEAVPSVKSNATSPAKPVPAEK